MSAVPSQLLNPNELDETHEFAHVTDLQQQVFSDIAGGNPSHPILLTDALEMMNAHTQAIANQLIDVLGDNGLLEQEFLAVDKELAFAKCGIGG